MTIANASYLDGIVVILKHAVIRIFVTRFNMQKCCRAGTTHNRSGGTNQSWPASIDRSRSESLEEWTASDMTGTNHHRNLVLAGCSHSEFHSRYIRIIWIVAAAQFTQNDDLIRCLEELMTAEIE